ncbi:uncharacterized protein [Antedon mediterranea]|uniref:uncharacterized protein n=1 Tax=Antedon mediterranea TaxID=105859 RepID=UPI003AF6BD0B
MAEVQNKVAPEPAPKPISGNVVKVRQKFGVLEDGALAHTLQEEEFSDHYTGNISRRRTVRKDIKTAKELASEAAIEAFAEEHEYVQRLKSIEEQDKETAKGLFREMMEEERRKAEESEQTDEEIAKQLQTEEVKKREREKMERESLRLARQLSQQNEAAGAVGGIPEEDSQQKVLTDEELAKRLQAAEIKKMREKHQRREAEAEKLTRKISETEQHSSSGTSQITNGESQRLIVNLPNGAAAGYDSDEDTDNIAQSTKDEILARKLQSQENQRQGQLTEEQLALMKKDEIIARKMQHEEAMIAKKKVYKRYQEKVDNEVAYLEPMVHIGLERKVSIPSELQHGKGITLTDIKVIDGQPIPEGTTASAILRSPPQSPGSPEQESLPYRDPPLPPPNANVFAAIDPTYKAPQSNNVRLIKQRSLSEDGPTEEEPKTKSASKTKSKKEKSKEKSKDKKDKHKEEPKDVKNEDKPLKKKRASFFGKKK